MNLHGIISVIDNFSYKDIKVEDLKTGMMTMANCDFKGTFNPSVFTTIFFATNTSSNKLLTKLTIRWKNKKESTITIYSKDITFGHYDYNIKTIPHKKYLNLGQRGELGKIIKVEYLVGRVSHFFTESGYFVVDNVLLKRSHDWLLSHAKYLNKLSTTMSRIESSLLGSYLV